MKQNKPLIIALALLTIVGLAAGTRILWKRANYEAANNTVEIVVNMEALTSVSDPGKPLEDIVADLEELGIHTAALFEYRGEDLISSGDLKVSKIRPGEGITDNLPWGDRSGMLLEFGPEWLRKRGPEYIEAYFGESACERKLNLCRIPDVGWEDVFELSFGLKPVNVDMEISPRFYNSHFETEKSIALKIGSLDSFSKPSILIFDGETILGYPTLLEDTAIGINNNDGWIYGMVEIIGQDGNSRLARNLPGKVAPVHSIPQDELSLLPPRKAIERYIRAVRERGIRVLYVHPYTGSYDRTLDQSYERNIKYLEALVTELKANGFIIGDAKPLEPFVVSKPMRALCIAGAVAFCGLLAAFVISFPAGLSLLAAAGVAGVVIIPQGAKFYDTIIKLGSLGVACFVPPFAIAALFMARNSGEDAGHHDNIPKTITKLAITCALTIAGGIFISSMLSERDFFIRLQVFSGVKLSFFLPLVLVCILYLKKTGQSINNFLSTPMSYLEFAAVIVLMGIVAVYIVRSGNEGPSILGHFDESFRRMLEGAFAFRPRTKEIFIGHPALIIAGLFPAARGKYFPAILLFFGVIGQVSIVNTFCHLHTPIMATIFRTFAGIIVGLVIGIGARAAVNLIFPLWKKL